jgi:hypothetical protein
MCGFQPESNRPVFEQSDIAAMRKALDGACDALSFAFLIEGSVDIGTREALARYIIEHATIGERNPGRLSAAALRKLPPRQAEWDDTGQRPQAKVLALRRNGISIDLGIRVPERA